MKKLLAGVAGVLITGAAVASYIGHSLARQVFDSQLAELRQAGPRYGMTVREARLEQGWLQGKSRLHLSFDNPDSLYGPVTMVVESDLHYGPLLTTASGLNPGLLAVASRVSLAGLAPASQHRLDALFGAYPLTLDAYFTLSQQVVAELKLPAARVSHQGEGIDFAGARVGLIHDVKSGSYVGELAVGRLRIESGDTRLLSAPARGHFAFTRLGNGLAPGELQFNFPEVVLQQGIDRFMVRDLGLRADSRLEEDGLWLSETFSIGELVPPQPIQDAALTFELERINPEAMLLWREMAPALQGEAAEPAQWRALAHLLLRQGAGLNVRYAMTAPTGGLRADLELAYRGFSDGRTPGDLVDPRQLIAALEGELRLEADEALLHSLPVAALLPQFMARGLVRLEQRQYRSEARLEQGQLSVNGVPFPFNGVMRPAARTQYSPATGPRRSTHSTLVSLP